MNWSGFDGAEFESLVHSLLFFEKPDIVLFGRPGKDCGQDAVSGDGRHVYQAKYGQILKMDDAISRSKTELAKIREYRRPGHKNHPFWKTVTHWTLVANFETNPFDREKWEREICSKNADLNLNLDYWDVSKLEALLTQYPDVEQAYFTGRNRSFAGLWEARHFLEQGRSGEYFFATNAYGWESQFQQLDKFEKSGKIRFLFVHGKAEVGKTRFLYEAGIRLSERGWRVFWGLPESMSLSDAWMRGITGPNKKTCLLIDGPTSVGLLNSIYEQLSTIDKSSWKVMIACPEHEFTDWVGGNALRSDTGSLELNVLSENAAKDFVNEFTEHFHMRLPSHPAENIYALTKGIPGWISLMLSYSHKYHGSFCLDSQLLQIINEQVKDVFRAWDAAIQERRLSVFRWTCAWKTVVLEDGVGAVNPVLSFLGNVLQSSPEQIHEDIKQLAKRGLLAGWGRNRRIYTAEPTLMRLQVLCEWLLELDGKSYRPTIEGRAFIEQVLKDEMPNKESIVGNLAELASSYMGKAQGVDFFKPLVDALLEEAVKADILQQFSLLDWAKRISSVDPESALAIVRQMWDHPASAQTVKHKYWGEQTFEPSQILEKIPWFLYSLAEQCRDGIVCQSIWKALKRIFNEEKAGAFKALSGQESGGLIKRLLGQIKRNRYQVLAFDDVVHACQTGPFSSCDLILAEGLLPCMKESVEAFGRRIDFSNAYILPHTQEWEQALKTRSLMFDVLEQNKYPEVSADIWSLLAKTHSGWKFPQLANRKDGEKLASYYNSVVLEDLTRARDILRNRNQNLGPMELAPAREIWKAALEQDKPADEHALALECEDEYRKHFTLDFSRFFTWDLFDNALEKALIPIKQLFETATTPQTIADFFKESAEFLRAKNLEQPDMDYGRGYDLANACFDLYNPTNNNAFSKFIEEFLHEPVETNYFRDHFFVHFLRNWIRSWKHLHPTDDIVGEIKRLIGKSEGKEYFLTGIYAGMSSNMLGVVSRQELSYVCSAACKFGNKQLACILPSFLGVDKDMVLERFGRILADERAKQVSVGLVWWLFVNHCYLVTIRTDNPGFPSPIKWLVDSFLQYDLSGNFLLRHELIYLAKRMGYKFSQKAFVELIENRIELEKSENRSPDFVVMPDDFEISAWVEMEKDECALRELCRLAVEEGTYLSIYQLPGYIAALDTGGGIVARYVAETLSRGTEIPPLLLRRLGGLASGYGESDNAIETIIGPICHHMFSHGVSRRDRYLVYQSFQPKFQIWSSAVGEIPQSIIDKEASTKHALEETSPNSTLYEYRVWAHDFAAWELKNAQDENEGEWHD